MNRKTFEVLRAIATIIQFGSAGTAEELEKNFGEVLKFIYLRNAANCEESSEAGREPRCDYKKGIKKFTFPRCVEVKHMNSLSWVTRSGFARRLSHLAVVAQRSSRRIESQDRGELETSSSCSGRLVSSSRKF